MIVLGAAFLAGCAPRAAVLLPAPPAEIAKAAPAKAPGGTPPSPASAPGPDPAKLYRDAVARTRELLAKGEGRKAIPLWVDLEGSPFAAEAVFNQGVLLQLSGDVDRAEELYRRAAAPPLLSQTGRRQSAGGRPAAGKPGNVAESRRRRRTAGRGTRRGAVAGAVGEPRGRPRRSFAVRRGGNLVPVGSENGERRPRRSSGAAP